LHVLALLELWVTKKKKKQNKSYEVCYKITEMESLNVVVMDGSKLQIPFMVENICWTIQ